MRLPVLISLVALAGCTGTPRVASLPAVNVTASGETEPVGTAAADAADDPAIWRNAANPLASLIIGTDKKAGLHVYGLDGKSRHFDPAGLLNNVDLADMGNAGVVVVASDRNDPAAAKLRIYRLDTAAARLMPVGVVPGGAGEAYGVCLWRAPDGLHAFSVLKDGKVEEVALDLSGATPSARPVRRLKLATQPEGCVVDPRDGTLFVGEEGAGIWRFAPGGTTGELVAKADGQHLVADVEGLALVTDGATGGFLMASSQGDNAYALFRLPGMEPAGRFRVAAGKFGSTEETDGIELVTGDFGPDYPQGLFVAQDGVNPPRAQNFKLVSWAAIKGALGL
jgi:3-phytase